MVALALLLSDPAHAAGYRRVVAAAARGRAEPLVRALGSDHVYLRELAARGLARTGSSDRARDALGARLADPAEAPAVRAACAVTLATWGHADIVPSVIVALDPADPEARYWLAWSLHALDTAEARAELRELTADADLYVSSSAREWLR